MCRVVSGPASHPKREICPAHAPVSPRNLCARFPRTRPSRAGRTVRRPDMKAFFWNNEWIWGIVFYTVGEEQQEKGDAAVENQVHIGKPQTLRAHGPWAVNTTNFRGTIAEQARRPIVKQSEGQVGTFYFC